MLGALSTSGVRAGGDTTTAVEPTTASGRDASAASSAGPGMKPLAISSAFLFRNSGLICTFVPGQPPFRAREVLNSLSFARSSIPSFRAVFTASMTLPNAISPTNSTSSWCPFKRSINGLVWNVNLNFCFGVRSACRITATIPFNFQECLGSGGGGGGGVSEVLSSGFGDRFGLRDVATGEADEGDGRRFVSALEATDSRGAEERLKLGGELIGAVEVERSSDAPPLGWP
jgi:hypothetical protein